MVTLEHLAHLYTEHRDFASARVKEFALGDTFFAFNSRPTIMGVINLSPDSWYRESVCLTQEQAILRASVLRAQGADIIDLGAESTLETASRRSQSEQSAKLIPVIEAIRRAGILVSAETYLPTVARACLEAGANVLNLTGSIHNREIYALAAAQGAAVILCHVQGPTARDTGDIHISEDPVACLYEYFSREIEIATRCGLEKLILDPGLGFYYQNLKDGSARIRYQMQVFLNTFRLRSLGFPVCNALPHAFEHFGEEVRSAEPFFAVIAALGHTDVFRTHEVPKINAVLSALTEY
ncbi:MAG: dihydropteroate synthase [Verrucomicrobia bacterium]|nr:dihydropteroate synthase [Verrucomicrobiota bacterium]